MSSKQTLKEALTQIAAVTRTKGFSKKEGTFSRKYGQVYQIIDFELTGDTFLFRVGFVFDELAMMGEAMGDYFGEALCEYSLQVPDQRTKRWKVGADAALLSQRILQSLNKLWPRLDAISSASTMLQTEPLQDGKEKLLRAQLKYVTGLHQQALQDVMLVVQEFSNRKIDGETPTPEALITRYSMPALLPLYRPGA